MTPRWCDFMNTLILGSLQISACITFLLFDLNMPILLFYLVVHFCQVNFPCHFNDWFSFLCSYNKKSKIINVTDFHIHLSTKICDYKQKFPLESSLAYLNLLRNLLKANFIFRRFLNWSICLWSTGLKLIQFFNLHYKPNRFDR